MSLPHFFAPSVEGDVITLDGEEARHARGSLRIRAGEEISVSDGRGSVVRARVVRAGETLEAGVIERRAVDAARPRVIVFPAVPKSGKLDLVVEKLTELGVDEIRPWFAARTVVRWDARTAASRAQRWRAIAFAASKQSHRAWLPVVGDPAALQAFPVTTVVLHEEAKSPMRDALPENTDEIAVVLGPEGGLAAEEVGRFESLGARTATLGAQILRTETAAIVAATIALYRYGRLG